MKKIITLLLIVVSILFLLFTCAWYGFFFTSPIEKFISNKLQKQNIEVTELRIHGLSKISCNTLTIKRNEETVAFFRGVELLNSLGKALAFQVPIEHIQCEHIYLNTGKLSNNTINDAELGIGSATKMELFLEQSAQKSLQELLKNLRKPTITFDIQEFSLEHRDFALHPIQLNGKFSANTKNFCFELDSFKKDEQSSLAHVKIDSFREKIFCSIDLGSILKVLPYNLDFIESLKGQIHASHPFSHWVKWLNADENSTVEFSSQLSGQIRFSKEAQNFSSTCKLRSIKPSTWEYIDIHMQAPFTELLGNGVMHFRPFSLQMDLSGSADGSLDFGKLQLHFIPQKAQESNFQTTLAYSNDCFTLHSQLKSKQLEIGEACLSDSYTQIWLERADGQPIKIDAHTQLPSASKIDLQALLFPTDKKLQLNSFVLHAPHTQISIQNTQIGQSNLEHTELLIHAQSSQFQEITNFFPKLSQIKPQGRISIEGKVNYYNAWENFQVASTLDANVQAFGMKENFIQSGYLHVQTPLLPLDRYDTTSIQTLRTELRGFKYQEHELAKLEIDCAQSHNKHYDTQLHAVCKKTDTSVPFDLYFTFQTELNRDDTSLIVQKIEGTWNEKAAKLTAPLQIYFSPQSFSLQLPHLELDHGSFAANWTSYGAQHQGYIHAQNFPLDFLNFFIPHNLKGKLTTDLNFTSLQEDVQAHIKGQLEDFSLELGKKHASFNTLLFAFDLNPQSLQTTIKRRVNANEHTLLSIWGENPLEFYEQEVLSWAKFKRYWGLNPKAFYTTKFDLQISQISQLLLPKDFDIRGEIKGEIDGELAKFSNLNGHFNIHDASFYYNPLHLALFNIQSFGKIEQSIINFESLSGSDDYQGKLTLSGKLAPYENWRYNFTGKFDNLSLLQTSILQSNASGQGQISGNYRQAIIKGDLVLKQAHGRIPNILPESIPDLGDFIIRRLNKTKNLDSLIADTSEPQDKTQDSRYPLILDLNIAIPKETRLSGRGLDSNWQGNLRLSGTQNQPTLHGKLALVKGVLNFGGKKFDVTEGQVHFNGDPKKDTRIQIVSELPLEHVTIRAILRGPITAPKLDFQATPTLSLPDIFSHILFGKNIDSLSSFQAVQVAQLALEASGENSDLDLFSKFRQSSGLDLINVESSSSEDASYSVKLGKYLSRNFLIGVSKDVSNEGTTVNLELDLTKHLSVIAELGYLSDSQLSLMWKRDY